MKSPLLSTFTPYVPDSRDFQMRGLRSGPRLLKTGNKKISEGTPPSKAKDCSAGLWVQFRVCVPMDYITVIETVSWYCQGNIFSRLFRENNLPLMEFNSVSLP